MWFLLYPIRFKQNIMQLVSSYMIHFIPAHISTHSHLTIAPYMSVNSTCSNVVFYFVTDVNEFYRFYIMYPCAITMTKVFKRC